MAKAAAAVKKVQEVAVECLRVNLQTNYMAGGCPIDEPQLVYSLKKLCSHSCVYTNVPVISRLNCWAVVARAPTRRVRRWRSLRRRTTARWALKFWGNQRLPSHVLRRQFAFMLRCGEFRSSDLEHINTSHWCTRPNAAAV